MNRPGAEVEAVVIGASAGAVEALGAILPELPRSFSLPILIVVHVPPDHPSALVQLFRPRCRIDVREAEDKEPIQGGTIYFAPPDYHLLVECDGRLSLSGEEPVEYSRPSIDVLFESSADAYGDRLIGAVLSGANADGAKGLRAIVAAGGVAVVQRPAAARADAMPRAALLACPHALVLDPPEIARYLVEAATLSSP